MSTSGVTALMASVPMIGEALPGASNSSATARNSSALRAALSSAVPAVAWVWVWAACRAGVTTFWVSSG